MVRFLRLLNREMTGLLFGPDLEEGVYNGVFIYHGSTVLCRRIMFAHISIIGSLSNDQYDGN